MNPIEPNAIAWAAQTACLFEINAEKPGNVSRVKDFIDSCYEDFMVSAVAIGPAFLNSPEASVGETILRAVRDTRKLVGTNTNLGIVILLAPLAKAAGKGHPKGLRAAVTKALDELTVDDSRRAYEAIRIAAPGWLGKVERYDVREAVVDINLREAMRLAQDRDTVAREYITYFQTTFELGYSAMRRFWEEGYRVSDSIVQTFLTILAQEPDALIARKKGMVIAGQVSEMAGQVLEKGGAFSPQGQEELRKFDHAIRDEKHRLNPGTTADLTVATLFVFLIEHITAESFTDLMRRW